jgi:hypothetical protein
VQTIGTTVVETSLPPIPTAAPRLAEMVVHITECNPRLAMAAVEAALGATDPAEVDRLAVVASALVSVRRAIDLRDPQPVARAVD